MGNNRNKKNEEDTNAGMKKQDTTVTHKAEMREMIMVNLILWW